MRNVKLAGVSETELDEALPVRDTVCGLFAALSVIESTAARIPEAVGVIVTPTTHEDPKASVAPHVLEVML